VKYPKCVGQYDQNPKTTSINKTALVLVKEFGYSRKMAFSSARKNRINFKEFMRFNSFLGRIKDRGYL
jgi:hypothetical protein